MADYTTYANYVSSICDSGNISGFRVHPSYTYMLEHVSEEVGAQYLDAILSFSSITEKEIIEFCAKNDVVGDPAKYVYDNMCVSPTSLRYIFQAHLVLTHMKATSQLNIDAVELGGGYGGLCLALFHFAPKYDIHIKSYKICDLPDIITLQKLYLGKVDPALPVEFVDATTHGENIDCHGMFLISNYCFSEISKENQESYIQKLFPKIAHGFIAWNMIPVYDFGFTTRVEHEFPNTGSGPKDTLNKYVYF